MDIKISRAAARSAANRLKAMSNEHRLFILCQLLGGERRVAELERLTGLGQSALSQHLAKLRKSNLVRTRRESQTILYSLADDDLDQVLGVLHRLFYTAGPAHRTAAATATTRRGASQGGSTP
jgi:DNA-binding transcriptional ArsR family regulator